MIFPKAGNKRGFSVVELLIIVVVIGILSVLVAITYSGIQAKSRDTERKTDINQLSSRLEAYFAQNNKYPTLSQMNDNDTDNAKSFVSQNMKDLSREAFRDPSNKTANPYKLVDTPTNNAYAYAVTPANCDNGSKGDCTAYTLTATLEGGGTYVKNSLN